MLARLNHLVVLVIGWLAAASAVAQTPAGPAVAVPLPGTSAYGGQFALPYPTTSTPEPVYPASSASVLPGSLGVAWRSTPVAEILSPPQFPLPADDEFPPADGDDQIVDAMTPGDDGGPAWYERVAWLGPTPWDTGIELGINGSSGTSESLSVRTGGYIKRESRFSKLDLSAYYNRTTTGGIATQNNAQLDVRNDWLLDDSSPWTLFATGSLFYDHFQAFDVQLNGNLGIGYRIVNDTCVSLVARCGAGASREFGGPDDQWVPESLLGFEYEQQLSTTQKCYGKLDYLPEWDEVGEYRLVADAGWEVELVRPSNLSLKISATDRFDSTSNGADPHLLNYSVLLLLKL